MFKLTFLGTSAGMPTKHRNVTALAIECLNPYLAGDKQQSKSKRPWVLVDCGEGTQHQLLHTKLSVQQLAIICITHVHGDHCYGLPGLLANMAMSGRKEKLTLIAPRAIAKFLDALTIATELYFDYPIEFITIEDYLKDSVDAIEPKPLTFDFSANHALQIVITPLSHRVASHAFSLTQTVSTRQLDTDKLKALDVPAGPIWGKLQNGIDVDIEGKTLFSDDFVEKLTLSTKIVVAGDNDTPQLLSQATKNARLLIHEATYTQEVLDRIMSKAGAETDVFDPMHTTAKSIATFAESVQLPHLILTHFSARYQPFDDPTSQTANMADIRLEAESSYQGSLWLAEDFAQFLVDDNKVSQISDE